MRKLTLPLAVLTLTFASSAAAQVPVPQLPAPPGSVAEGVEHVGNIPVNGSVGANFKTYGDKTYMFVTGTLGSPRTDPGVLTQINYGGLWVYDVTVADSPALVSHLPVPHYENEDVSIGGDRLLISGDGTLGLSNLVVVDIADPALPMIEKVINMDPLGPGHTATCIQDCRYVWAAGDGNISVLALDDYDVVGSGLTGTFRQPEFGWGTHDVQVDDAGIAWVVGGNGTIGFDVTPEAYGDDNLTTPTVVARTNDEALENQTDDGSSVNDFIHHNSWRPNATEGGDTVLITEEDIWTRSIGLTRGGCKTQGSFQTWNIDDDGDMTFVDDWKTEYNDALIQGLPTQDVVAAEGFCSAHYFDATEDGDQVAIAWYAQGTRILDTSDPADIKQVGYFLAPDSTVWASYYAPHDENVVYVLDHQRGIDILRIPATGSAAAGTEVRAPFLKAWKTPRAEIFAAHPTLGWVCRIAR
jgi:hypothetical protein